MIDELIIVEGLKFIPPRLEGLGGFVVGLPAPLSLEFVAMTGRNSQVTIMEIGEFNTTERNRVIRPCFPPLPHC